MSIKVGGSNPLGPTYDYYEKNAQKGKKRGSEKNHQGSASSEEKSAAEAHWHNDRNHCYPRYRLFSPQSRQQYARKNI